jgi:hypothetical protein
LEKNARERGRASAPVARQVSKMGATVCAGAGVRRRRFTQEKPGVLPASECIDGTKMFCKTKTPTTMLPSARPSLRSHRHAHCGTPVTRLTNSRSHIFVDHCV